VGTDPGTSAAPVSTGEYHHPRRVYVRHKENALHEVDERLVLRWKSICTGQRCGWTTIRRRMGEDFDSSIDLL